MTESDRRLETHRLAVMRCRVCAHPPEVQPVVSMASAPKAMLVGQAPGRVEARGGAPFSGRAGRTLFSWLERAGIDEKTARSRIYIAAITRCYPGPSASGRGDRVPTPAERSNCSSWLSAELRIIRPALLIPVGRLAIDAFLGPAPLDAVIGREHVVSFNPDGSLAREEQTMPARKEETMQDAVVKHDAGHMSVSAGHMSVSAGHMSLSAEHMSWHTSVVVPLPHPSGASSWIHQHGHGALLDAALQLIARRWAAIVTGRRVA